MSSIWDKWKDTKIIYPKRKHLKLKELDKIPYYNENNEVINHKKFEREEQYISNDYINPDMTVLELGGRYGTVSCVINNKLENPKNHIVIEPDITVIDSLKKNKKSHKSKFKILNVIISNKKMKINKKGYATTVSLIKDENEDEEVIKNYSLKYIMKKYKINFDALVVDCEGCLCNFIDENEKYVKNYKIIIFERDMPNDCNYNLIDEKLEKWGFKLIIKGFVCVWRK